MLQILISFQSIAQPQNNNICSAIPIDVEAPNSIFACGSTAPYTTTAGTTEEGEQFGGCYTIVGTNSVWFSFVAPSEGAVAISTDHVGGTNKDTQISLWEGNIGCPSPNFNNLSEIACNEDVDILNNDFLSKINSTPVVPGQTYYVQVSGWNNTPGSFCITVLRAAPCNFDNFCNPNEDFCECTDCPCSAQVLGVDWPTLNTSSSLSMYCPEALTDPSINFDGGTNNDLIFLPFLISSDRENCSENGNIGSINLSVGTLYNSTSPPTPAANNNISSSIYFLGLTQADIRAAFSMAAGYITISYNDLSMQSCTATNSINLNPMPTALINNICVEDPVCQDNLYVPGPLLNGLYQAEQNLNSDNQVLTGNYYQNINFQAGVDIDLNPGFCIPTGGEFSATISPCTGLKGGVDFDYGNDIDVRKMKMMRFLKYRN